MADSIAEVVRAADRDRYLAALYAPAGRRADLMALHAFNAEIAGIRDRIREALPGEIRLQWWRDTIASGDLSGGGHPLAAALMYAIEAHGLPRGAFDSYLEARIFDLYDDPMPTRTDLEGYCGETASAMIQLSALVLDPMAATTVSDLAGHAGCAQAIAGLLRLLPIHRRRGQCFLPRDLLAAVGTTPEAFLSGEDKAAAARAVAAMAALGSEHMTAFLAGVGSLPPSLRPAFLPAALAPAYLAAIVRDPVSALSRAADVSALRRHWLLLRAASGRWPAPLSLT
ncbi:MAG: phytoene/squalene synthase family protein [Rhizobiaceae bacterium]|nr:MAG: phytoene/squalene synthase family protein [Rhizobiaceae bacterium]CAG0972581.1 15-cis-phytoene synthase [Rhizobiaceae bacterium]